MSFGIKVHLVLSKISGHFPCSLIIHETFGGIHIAAVRRGGWNFGSRLWCTFSPNNAEEVMGP